MSMHESLITAAGERKAALATEFGISRETVYSYLRPIGPAR